MPDEIHKGDKGTKFIVTIVSNGNAVDISAANQKKIIFDKPEKSGVLNKNADFVTDGTDGKIQYVTKGDDLDVIGVWSIQAKIVKSNETWFSNIEKFHVHDNIPT